MINTNYFKFLASINIICITLIFDLEALILGLPLFIFHLQKGLTTVIQDYIYFKYLTLFLRFLTQVSSLELIRYLLELLT